MSIAGGLGPTHRNGSKRHQAWTVGDTSAQPVKFGPETNGGLLLQLSIAGLDSQTVITLPRPLPLRKDQSNGSHTDRQYEQCRGSYWTISSSGKISKPTVKVGTLSTQATITAACMLPASVPMSVNNGQAGHSWEVDTGWFGVTEESADKVISGL
jgi:hypothetical protein